MDEDTVAIHEEYILHLFDYHPSNTLKSIRNYLRNQGLHAGCEYIREAMDNLIDRGEIRIVEEENKRIKFVKIVKIKKEPKLVKIKKELKLGYKQGTCDEWL